MERPPTPAYCAAKTLKASTALQSVSRGRKLGKLDPKQTKRCNQPSLMNETTHMVPSFCWAKTLVVSTALQSVYLDVNLDKYKPQMDQALQIVFLCRNLKRNDRPTPSFCSAKIRKVRTAAIPPSPLSIASSPPLISYPTWGLKRHADANDVWT